MRNFPVARSRSGCGPGNPAVRRRWYPPPHVRGGSRRPLLRGRRQSSVRRSGTPLPRHGGGAMPQSNADRVVLSNSPIPRAQPRFRSMTASGVMSWTSTYCWIWTPAALIVSPRRMTEFRNHTVWLSNPPAGITWNRPPSVALAETIPSGRRSKQTGTGGVRSAAGAERGTRNAT